MRHYIRRRLGRQPPERLPGAERTQSSRDDLPRDRADRDTGNDDVAADSGDGGSRNLVRFAHGHPPPTACPHRATGALGARILLADPPTSAQAPADLVLLPERAALPIDPAPRSGVLRWGRDRLGRRRLPW